MHLTGTSYNHVISSSWAIFTLLALKDFLQLFNSSWVLVLSHLSFILTSTSSWNLNVIRHLLNSSKVHRVDFISGTHHLNRRHLWFRLVTSIMTTIRQLAVVETLSILGLTPYLHRHDDEKYKTHVCLSNALPIELQAKFLCYSPERIRTSNPLIPIAC